MSYTCKHIVGPHARPALEPLYSGQTLQRGLAIFGTPVSSSGRSTPRYHTILGHRSEDVRRRHWKI